MPGSQFSLQFSRYCRPQEADLGADEKARSEMIQKVAERLSHLSLCELCRLSMQKRSIGQFSPLQM
jgi:hypothetical protein